MVVFGARALVEYKDEVKAVLSGEASHNKRMHGHKSHLLLLPCACALTAPLACPVACPVCDQASLPVPSARSCAHPWTSCEHGCKYKVPWQFVWKSWVLGWDGGPMS